MTLQTLEKNLKYSNCIDELSREFEIDPRKIVIRRWMVAGCFRGGIDDAIISKQRIDPNKYWNIDGLAISWKDATIDRLQPDNDHVGNQAAAMMFDRDQKQRLCSQVDIKLDDHVVGDSGVVYLATYIYSRKTACYRLFTICDSRYKIMQNGKEIFLSSEDGGADAIEISLRHGWNLIMAKAEYQPEMSFYGGLSTLEGKQFTDGWVKSGFMEGDDIDTQLFGKNPDDSEQAIEIGYIEDEYKRTKPDAVVYIPKEGDDHNDGDNEHFLVFNAPKSNELLAMWTQGSMEPSGDNHIMLARSEDGVNFSPPQWIVGTRKGTKQTQASWGFPVVASKTGRIYCFYCESPAGKLGGASGILGCHISDDNGQTWEYKGTILFPDCFDDINDLSTQHGGIIVWQKPIRDSKGTQVVGYTLCSKEYQHGCCRFMRFDNIDDGPEVEDIKITWLSIEGDTVSMPQSMPNRHCSEPAMVVLPDNRMFMVFRTVTGHIWYSVSDNDGRNWQIPQTLLYRDGGEPVKNPLTCCPIYQLNDGRYMLIYYNNSYYADYMNAGKPLPAGMSMFTHRRPAVYSIGTFKPDAAQPLWFDEPVELLDTDGVLVSPKASNEVATYPSVTYHNGKQTLWYPDRKFFLLGKNLNI